MEVERVSVFPAPFQIVLVQVRKAAALFEALSTLREWAATRGLGDVMTTPSADWVFHMTVAHCASLSMSAWEDVTRFIGTIEIPAAQRLVSEVETVAFDNGREYSGGVYHRNPSYLP